MPRPAPPTRTPRRLPIIGVTGLPASGKSWVAGLFAEHGARVADADALAHAALDEPAVARAVGERLGAGALDASGRVDRAAVARIVFGGGDFGGADPEALEQLTALVHPRVHARLRAAVRTARRAGATAVIWDVPLLFEAGLAAECDRTLFVDAPPAVRRRRAGRRGWSARELRARERRQWPAARRRRLADVVVRNGGTRTATRRTIDRIWHAWIEAERRQG